MNYISAEQFQEQPIKVQEVLLKWWKPSIGDLFVDKADKSDIECVDYQSDDGLYHTHRDYLSVVEDMIPLFTEGQLREFIETKSESKVRFIINPFTKTYVYTFSHYNITTHTGTDDLLQSYWQVACKIAEEVANEKE